MPYCLVLRSGAAQRYIAPPLGENSRALFGRDGGLAVHPFRPPRKCRQRTVGAGNAGVVVAQRQRAVRIAQDRLLLRLQDHLVLEEGRVDVVVKVLRRLGIVLSVAVRNRPEIVAARFRCRRRVMEQAETEGSRLVRGLDRAEAAMRRAIEARPTPIRDSIRVTV